MLNPACAANVLEAAHLVHRASPRTPHAPLTLRPTARPYPVREFLRASPRLRADITRSDTSIPLTLHIHLQDAGQQPMTRVAVCIWQHDTPGGPDSTLSNDLDIFANMGGLQITDAEGWVRFRTGYPVRHDDQRAPIFLQLYFNDGQHFHARSDVCLLMPERGSGPLQDILLARPAPLGLSRPRFSEVATLVYPERLRIDEALGGLHADVTLFLDF